MLNITNITPPRVPLTDSRTGLISREWYRFFLNLFELTGNGGSSASLEDLQVGPPQTSETVLDILRPHLDNVQPSDQSLVSQVAELQKQVQGLALGPRLELGTMSALQQSLLPWVTFDTTPESVPTDVGTLAWDGGTTLGVQMTANVLGRVNESGYYYIKASSTITKGQVIMFTGAVGASGVPTGAPATGVTDGSYIMGIAAENMATNAFGLVQFLGTLRGVNLSAYADGDILWYNPAVTGGLTKTKPSAPNVKVQMAAVISASNNGTMLVRVTAGSELGGTDSNVQFGTLSNGDLIQYDSALQYWKNVPPSSIVIGTASNVQTTDNTTSSDTWYPTFLANSTGNNPVTVASTKLSFVPSTGVFSATSFSGAGTGLTGTASGLSIGGNAATATSAGNLTGGTISGNYTLANATSPNTYYLQFGDNTGWTYRFMTSVAGAPTTRFSFTDTGNFTAVGSATAASFSGAGTGLTGTASGLSIGGSANSATTATNLAGGAAGSVPYQTAAGTTAFRSVGTAGQVFKVNAGATAPEWVSGAALTKTDDTNVTLTLGGSPTEGLLAAISLTLGWTGQLAVSRGGSGSSTAAGARSNFGATTVGSNLFTLTNPSAVTFLRVNADNTVSTLDAATFRSAIGAGTGDGSVTSVDASGGTTGLTFSGGPVTTSGTLTLAGTLAVGNGGTGNTSWTANGMLYASASNTLTNGSAVTYDGTTFGVTGKGSYLDPAFSTGGFNIVASYSYNDNNTNSIGSNFNNAHNIIHVRTSAGITSIPIYTNGGAGVAWAYNYLDPDAGSWAYSTTSPNITFTQNGTGGNTFSIVLNSNTGVGTIQRTAGTQSYTVSIQRLAV